MLEQLLDSEERGRCASLVGESDRQAYLVAHALRRLLLGQTLGVAPAEIRFSAEPQGRPTLAWPREAGLFFSHAHSREAVVCVCTRSGDIGVDAEPVRGEPDFAVLERFMVLPDAAQRAVEAGPDEAGQFFFYWTSLEAFWKAFGVGLSGANPRLRLRPSGDYRFEASFEHDSDRITRARLVRLAPRGNCAMTLALRTAAAHPFQSELPGAALQQQRDDGKLFQSVRSVSATQTRRLPSLRRNVV